MSQLALAAFRKLCRACSRASISASSALELAALAGRCGSLRRRPRASCADAFFVNTLLWGTFQTMRPHACIKHRPAPGTHTAEHAADCHRQQYHPCWPAQALAAAPSSAAAVPSHPAGHGWVRRPCAQARGICCRRRVPGSAARSPAPSHHSRCRQMAPAAPLSCCHLSRQTNIVVLVAQSTDPETQQPMQGWSKALHDPCVICRPFLKSRTVREKK